MIGVLSVLMLLTDVLMTPISRPLGLHQITAMEATPLELVSIARQVTCSEVCIFTHLPQLTPEPEDTESPFPVLTRSDLPDMKARLSDDGVTIANIEFFSLTPWMNFDAYTRGLELGAELSARCAVTHIMDPEPNRVRDHLSKLNELAAAFNLKLAVEFMAMSPDCSSIGAALDLVQSVGSHNLGIAVDMLHLIRSGGVPADAESAPPERIFYAQICDGKHQDVTEDYMEEAINDRSIPGSGVFPIADILAALPPDTPLDVEVPRLVDQLAGMGPLERARAAVSAAKHYLV